MKISSLNQMKGQGKTADPGSKKVVREGPKKSAVETYLPGSKGSPKVTTYSRASVKADSSLIAGLRAESDKAYEFLRRIVVELLEKQGSSMQGMKVKGPEIRGADQAAAGEAAALIADDGPLGAEAVSQRIVDFAISASGGDKARLPEIKRAIEQGFAQVKHMLGGLPEVSLRTYDLIMEKLNQWEEAE